MDVRNAYVKVKEALEDPQYSKVIFIVHSQGAIEGSMIVDWLLDEVPQDLLYQLEIYTFGNASNHMNNPHKSLAGLSMSTNQPPPASDRNPSIITQVVTNGVSPSTSASSPVPEKAIGHIGKQHPPLLVIYISFKPQWPADAPLRTLRPRLRLRRPLGCNTLHSTTRSKPC